ncbi:arsenic resistance protein [Roseixanthobacter liquoris]|uniref:arsenic resistance protein n=1 Tax=Roseixanthobacter liquoris TaxID=3119921 RepID=UPI003727F795
MTRFKEHLEGFQVWIYFAAILIGALVGLVFPNSASLEPTINPALALMLFVTFLQVPLAHLREALRNIRFLGALIVANFVVIPLLAAGIFLFLPNEPMLRLAVLLVLLTPCIDYVVTFTHLGRGDARLLLAATPILLILQMLLLPAYLNVFMGAAAVDLVQPGPLIHAFVWLIAIPLLLAGVVQLLSPRYRAFCRTAAFLELLPVPATALVLFLVLASVMPQVGHAVDAALSALPFYVLFAMIAPILGLVVAKGFRLSAPASRAVIFSSATRNSLVVLPLAFAVPGGVPVLPAVIVMQTVVELLSALIYIRVVPRFTAIALKDVGEVQP